MEHMKLIGSKACRFALLIAFAFLFSLAVPVQSLNLALLDTQFLFLRLVFPQPAKAQVVVVGIDEASINAFSEPMALWHRHLGKLLEGLAAAQPAVVGLDVVLPDRSYDAILPGYDLSLIRGIVAARRGAKLVVGLTTDSMGKLRPILPVFMTAAGPDGMGYALWLFDRDNVIRRFDERLGVDGQILPTLVGQMARRLGVQIDKGLIDYTRGPAFQFIPLKTVLEWMEARENQALIEAFTGKVVIVGSVLPFTDRIHQPVNMAGWEENDRFAPAVLVHAQALRSILGNGLIQPIAMYWVMALALAATLLVWVPAMPRLTALVATTLTLGMFAASTWLLTRGVYVPASPIVLTGFAALAWRQGITMWEKLVERRYLRKIFAGYVSPRIFEDIVAGRLTPSLGGTRRRLCILFADIRGFTARSERMPPEAVVEFLDRYFEEVTEIIHRYGGTVDKFMGDGIMAFFGAPQPMEKPAAQGYEVATAILNEVARLGSQRAEGAEPLAVGIGLHVGEAVVGHVGSTNRHNYTAIGDAVNLASRLEGLSKEVGWPLICSKDLVDELGDTHLFTSLGLRAIRGHAPLEIYGWRPDVSA